MKLTAIIVFTLVIGAANVFAQPTPKPSPTPTLEELKAKLAAENAKITAENEAIKKAASEAGAAYAQQDFKRAITICDAAIKAYPDHPAVPQLMANKALAQLQAATVAYNAALTKPTELATAKQQLRDAAATTAQAWGILKKVPSDESATLAVAAVRAEAGRMVANYVDPAQLHAAVAAYSDYFALESDPAKTVNAQRLLGDLYLDLAEPAKARTQYEKVLASSPKNSDALVGYGLATFQTGSETEDKALFQKAADSLKAFLAIATATHPRRKDATDTLIFLKENYQISPK